MSTMTTNVPTAPAEAGPIATARDRFLKMAGQYDRGLIGADEMWQDVLHMLIPVLVPMGADRTATQVALDAVDLVLPEPLDDSFPLVLPD